MHGLGRRLGSRSLCLGLLLLLLRCYCRVRGYVGCVGLVVVLVARGFGDGWCLGCLSLHGVARVLLPFQ